jgi:DNA-binding CsgD family transcriptional regulator
MSIAAPDLTRREIEVLALSAQGKTAQKIADSLGITKRTVNAHRQAIVRKLGVSNITQAVSIGIASQLVRLP